MNDLDKIFTRLDLQTQRIYELEKGVSSKTSTSAAVRLDRIEEAHKLLDKQHTDGLATTDRKFAAFAQLLHRADERLDRLEGQRQALHRKLQEHEVAIHDMKRAEDSEPEPGAGWDYTPPNALELDGERLSYGALVSSRETWKVLAETRLDQERAASAKLRAAEQEIARLKRMVSDYQSRTGP